MYILWRLVLCAVLGVLIYIFIRKKVLKKVVRFLILMLPFILVTVLFFIPFENLFIDFDSPEKVYKYVNYGNKNIKVIVPGEKVDLVVGNKNNSDVYYTVPKNGDTWKIGVTLDTKIIDRKIEDDFVIMIHHYTKSNDYFVTVIDRYNKIKSISDSKQSDFILPDDSNNSVNNTFATYYANVRDFNELYWINVDGEIITLDNKSVASMSQS